ncbi:MAG TPA: DUF2254 family protein, partial [Pelobium sp.]
INDPGTAIIAMRALFELYLYRLTHYPPKVLCNTVGKAAIVVEELSFEKIFTDTIIPIWNYGKADRMLQKELLILIPQLQQIHQKEVFKKLLSAVEKEQEKQLM